MKLKEKRKTSRKVFTSDASTAATEREKAQALQQRSTKV